MINKIKSNKQNILSFIITLFMTILILSAGYIVIAKNGESYLLNDGEITRLSTDGMASYVFYSQSDSDITLYPWNHYVNVVPYTSYFENKPLSETVDTEYIYQYLTYYFYRMLPPEKCQYIYNEDSIPLRERIDFDNLDKYTEVKIEGDNIIFFCSNDLEVDGTSYTIKYSFTPFSEVTSFQITDNTSVNDLATLSKGKTFLYDFASEAPKDYITNIAYDIYALQNWFESYTLLDKSYCNLLSNNTDDKKISNSGEDIEKYEEELKQNDKYTISSEINSEETGSVSDSEPNVSETEKTEVTVDKVTNSSLQIIETKNELLIILLDYDMILHFDPVNSIITGFNLSE